MGLLDPEYRQQGIGLLDVQPSSSMVMDRVLQQWPRLQQYNWNLIDSTAQGQKDMRRIEFYPPDEGQNPTPGRPTIEVFDPRLRGDALEAPLAGDMLHYLTRVDPTWAAMRNEFAEALTPEQRATDRQAYQTHQQRFGEKRPFDKWMEISRLDQYLGAGLKGPVEGSDWSTERYSQQQHAILGRMSEYLQGTQGRR